MRTIDADAVLKNLGMKTDDCNKCKMSCSTEFTRQDFCEAVHDAPTIGGWISADKRPPKQGRYLVWGLTQFIPDHTDEPNGYWQTKIAQWFDGIGWDCKVKFWQMLPEPPKEGDK
jgi:hypothetical protein